MNTMKIKASRAFIKRKIDKYDPHGSDKELKKIKDLVQGLLPVPDVYIVECLEKACSLDSGLATMVLASMYKHGTAVKKDLEKAITYYKIAERYGIFMVAYKLKKCYSKIEDTKKATL